MSMKVAVAYAIIVLSLVGAVFIWRLAALRRRRRERIHTRFNLVGDRE